MRSALSLTICLVLAAPALLTAPAALAAPSVSDVEKVAVVEIQRVLIETSQGIKAKKSLERKFKKGQAKLDRGTKELQKQVKDLQAKAAMLSQAELQKRQQELILKEQELQQIYMELQEEISNDEAILVEKVYKNVQTIVKGIAAQEGLEIVLVKSPATVLHANPKLDITNRVIVAYDKKFK